jgi:peptidoglycan/LPS O-acetylase OafA/YrhL
MLLACEPSQAAAKSIDAATSAFLDAARWISAAVVVVCHASSFLLVSPDNVAEPTVGLEVFFCLRNAGHLAVAVFFVVSGFLVGGQELGRFFEARHFAASRYAIQRFSRIYTVLVPALLLTLVLDLIGQTYFNHSLLYTVPAADGIDSLKYVIADRHDPAITGGNLAMLQTVAVPPLGGNGPLWSLANEWWYYVVFGLTLLSISANRPLLLRLVAIVTAVSILTLVPTEISWWFTLWLAGAGAAVVRRHWTGPKPALGLCLMITAFVTSLWGMQWMQWQESSSVPLKLMLDGITALGFLIALLSARNASRHGAWRGHHVLAGFSYTLYLVHFPALILLAAIAHDVFGVVLAGPPAASSAPLLVLFVAILAIFGWAFACLTEQNTPIVRDTITQLVDALRRTGMEAPRPRGSAGRAG